MNYKNIITIDISKDKKKNIILNDLSIKGISEIDISKDSIEWGKTLRSFGNEISDLRERNMISPLFKTDPRDNIKKRLIKIPNDVEITKSETKNKINYRFKRRRRI